MSKERLLASILFTGVLLAGVAFAQDAAPQTEQQVPPSNSTDKLKDKKTKGDDVLNTDVFTEDVARYLLGEIRDGLEGDSQHRFLSAFDNDKMPGYVRFKDEIEAVFDRYSGFRVHFRILQTTVEGSKGIVLVSFDLEELSSSLSAQPQRKSSQIRFEVERGRRGWRVVDFSPRGFFY